VAITTRSQLVAALANRKILPFYKNLTAVPSQTAQYMRNHSSWANSTAAGIPPQAGGAGVAPGVTMSSQSVSAAPVPTAAAGATWYLSGINVQSYEFSSGTAQAMGSQLLVYDRLAQMGGLSSTSAGNAQTVTAGLPSRVSDKRQVQIFLEIYVAGGSTSTAVSASYTNEAGVAGRTATLATGAALPGSGSSPVGTIWGPFNLQAGDYGVTSVETLTFTTSTGTAGNFGVTLARLVGVCPLPGSNQTGPVRLGWAETGLPDLGADPCLFFMVPGQLAGPVGGYLEVVQG